MRLREIVRVVVLLLLVCAPAAAQETVNYASVSGVVSDATSGVLPGAVVTARAIDTNVATTSTTTKDGRFRFSYLKVGAYDIHVQLAGFASVTRRLSLNAGAAVELPVTLTVGGASTSVDVTAPLQTLETARSQIAGTVLQAEIAALPMNGRNFLDLALLIPGVSPTNNGGTQLFSETSAVPGTGISVGSQRNFSNSFLVDGMSANDDAAGLSGMPYGVDAVEQFQVVTSGGHAELGRALGGYVSVITRSGGNVFHGSAYDFFRDDSLNAVNALSGTKLPLRQQQYGGSIGGPIRRDRTFFFANVEQRRLNQAGLATISDANVASINTRLQAIGYPGALISTGIYDNPVHST
ncbi:MAG: carboxypeptidase regulatory-like domain-containing protein, partial [Acidobacteriota bacterium]